MEKFIIEVTRISYGVKKFEILAETKEQAEFKAVDKAHNEVFETYAADYETD